MNKRYKTAYVLIIILLLSFTACQQYDQNSFIESDIGNETMTDNELADLFSKLESEDKQERDYAWAKFQIKKNIPLLLKALKNPYDDVRVKAAEKLGALEQKEAVQGLIEALKDEKNFVREKAAIALGRIGDKQAIPALVEVSTDEYGGARSAAITALGRIDDVQAVPTIIEALDSNEVGHAIDALAMINDSRVGPALVKLLDQENPFIRESAIFAMLKIKYTDSIPKLIELITDKAPTQPNPHSRPNLVADAAIYALGELKAKEAVPALFNALEDEDLSGKAAQSLVKIGGEDVITTAVDFLLTSDNKSARANASWILARFGDKETLEKALEKEQDDWVKKSIEKGLRDLK